MPGQRSTPQLLLGVTAEFYATKAFSWGISGKGTFVGRREGAQRVEGGWATRCWKNRACQWGPVLWGSLGLHGDHVQRGAGWGPLKHPTVMGKSWQGGDPPEHLIGMEPSWWWDGDAWAVC